MVLIVNAAVSKHLVMLSMVKYIIINLIDLLLGPGWHPASNRR